MVLMLAACAVLLCAGCTEQPANEASRLAAIEAKTSSENLAARVDGENTRRAQQHAELLAAVERAKSEPLPSRVPELAQGDPLKDKSSHAEVRVWACSLAEPDRQSAMMAEMTVRQLLLLARGASVTVGGDGLKINSAATIPGVRVTEKEQTGAYTLVQLDADVRVEAPPWAKQGGCSRYAVSNTVVLSGIITAVSQSVEEAMKRHQEAHGAATDGFVVLRKMQLVPKTDPPQCRYEVDVYAPGQ
jgi:hypothetical protein